MASVFTHAFVAVAMGKVYAGGGRAGARFWVLSAACAVLPDADVLGFAFGVGYGDTFGHRGFTHSILFAALVALAVVALFFRGERRRRAALFVYFFLVTVSHALLDMLTDGGLGVALLSPLGDERYFFPFRPVEVSPIGVGRFFSEWGLRVIKSELLWVWSPTALVVLLVLTLRRALGRGKV
jgi:inner membrane protein